MFITSEARVLVALHAASNQAQKQSLLAVAREVELTERHVMSLVRKLISNGYVTVERQGRNNVYSFPGKTLNLIKLIRAVEEVA